MTDERISPDMRLREDERLEYAHFNGCPVADEHYHREAVERIVAARVEQAWMEGAFCYGGDAAEQWYFNEGGAACNPYRAEQTAETEETLRDPGACGEFEPDPRGPSDWCLCGVHKASHTPERTAEHDTNGASDE